MTTHVPRSERADAVGLVGRGHLTDHIASRLLDAGRRLVVLNRDQQQSRRYVARGAGEVANAFYLTSAVDTVLLDLPDVHALESVMEGPDGVLSALAPGQLVVNLGASLPSSDRRLAALVAARGGQMLDAPLIRRGEHLMVPVGGSPDAFQAARPLLELLAQRVAHVGPSGSGQLTKLLDQMLQAARTVAMAEGLSFARRVGLDSALIAELLDLPGAEPMLLGAFDGHGELRQHTRDLGYALEVAQEAGLLAPLTATTNEIYKAVAAHGESSWQEAAIIRYWE
ncbi:MAG TPA: NAD(P)-dependent oxidoreductase [Chloroflexota bacterium]